jgi:DNA polymerase-4/protein ImuB
MVCDRVIEALSQRSPLVEKAALGCAYVGVEGLEAMYGGEARLVASLLQATPHDFNARIGVAEGKFSAYVAAVVSGGGQATRVPRDVAGFLARFPIELLPISWDKKERLHRFGLHTIGQLASMPVGPVQAQFGPEGKVAWELANGVDRGPLVPHKQEEMVVESLTFPSPATTLYAVLPALETLLGRAFSRPGLRGRRARTAAIESRVLYKPPWTRRFAFKQAVNGRDRAMYVLRGALETADLPGALEDMKLTMAGITGDAGTQAGLFPDARRQEQLRETMRQLEARLGARPPVYQVRDVEPWSRIPERRQALVQFEP